MLCSPKPWLERAQREQFAIGAFNANTLEQVQAIVLAAQEECAPVLIQISHRALQYAGSGNEVLGLRYMAAIGKIAAQSVSVPIALHLDHATESEVLQALSLGFTSVMFDGGDLPFEENVRITKKLRDVAHGLGACLEAEVGAVPRLNSAGGLDDEVTLTDVEDARRFAEATEVDILAIALGSVHAIKEKRIRIDLDRLKAIRTQVQVPLVLHGSSGVTDADIAAGIKLGLAKINTATQLNQAFTAAVRSKLAADSAEVDPRKYLTPARDAMKERVRERIRFIGAAGKAVGWRS